MGARPISQSDKLVSSSRTLLLLLLLLLVLLILGLIFVSLVIKYVVAETSIHLHKSGHNGKLNFSISIAEFPIAEAFVLRFI